MEAGASGTYLSIRRADVADFAHFGDLGFDFVGERNGREDGEGAGLEAHWEARQLLQSYTERAFLPMVPRPPILILPNRQKGTDMVVMTLGTTSRMTMTLAGSEGTSL